MSFLLMLVSKFLDGFDLLRLQNNDASVTGARDAADEGEVEEATYALLPPGWTKPTSGKKREMASHLGAATDASTLSVLLVPTWRF